MVSRPAGAKIVACGAETGEVTPATIEVPADRSCVLELRLAGYRTRKIDFELALGQRKRIRATLRPRRRRAPTKETSTKVAIERPRDLPRIPAGLGKLIVTSIQIGTVYVNRMKMGRTPKLAMNLRPGRYIVRVRFGGGLDSRAREVRVGLGRTTRVHVDPAP